jgi:alpha-1,3/alpha-1,6-mannosyltransferase
MAQWFLFVPFLILFFFYAHSKLKSNEIRKKKNRSEKLSVAFLHPDLGIGGAEKLVVEAALGLQKKGHSVKIFTSFHDKNRCFPATSDGTLDVVVAGDWLPSHTKGLFQLPKALIRFFCVSIELLLQNKQKPFDILIVDQIAATMPLLRLSGAKIIFYCHFPDQLLAKRDSLLKSLYRYPFDVLEEITTATSDLTLVNSKFTLQIFHDTFKSIKQSPKVLYPCVNIEGIKLKELEQKDCSGKKKIQIVSLNRYERKKNIELALSSFSILLKIVDHPLELVIAGGYSELVQENIEYHLELVDKCKSLGIEKYVKFLFSISDEACTKLLQCSICLLYTPENEHFGITPLEAGLQGIPVIACNSGGPLESILDNETGYTKIPNPEEWAECMKYLIEHPSEALAMGKLARERVAKHFSNTAQANQLEEHMFSLVNINFKSSQ